MTYRITERSNALPVSLEDLRTALRQTDPTVTFEDWYLTQLIEGAARYFENYTRRPLMVQQREYTIYADEVRVWGGKVPIAGTMRAVLSVHSIDDEGTATLVPTAEYRVVVSENVTWLYTNAITGDIRVLCEMGFAVDTYDVPADIRNGILQMCATQYALRQDQVFGEGLSAPQALYSANTLFAPYRCFTAPL